MDCQYLLQFVMMVINGCSLIAFLTFVMQSEGAVKSSWFTLYTNRYLPNHLIKSVRAISQVECSMQCSAEEGCESWNMYEASMSDRNCELNNATVNAESSNNALLKKDGAIFGHRVKLPATKNEKTHPTQWSYSRNLTDATSCLYYFKKGYRSSGYYQIRSHGANNSFQTVLCDMESEPGSAWTLVESFALKNKATPAFSRHTFNTNAPVLPKTPNWNLYRMSYSQMNDLKSWSTHWRVTCNFQAKPVDIYRDYAVAKFTNFDVMTFTGLNVCKLMKYINVRGHKCDECTAGWYAFTKTQSMHFDSPSTGCQFTPRGGSVHSEDNFGLYDYTNSNFRCTSSPDATTNYWFGGYF